MGKTKTDKRINRIVKYINKDLEKDVFGNRFWLKQIRKTREYDIEYYLYELKDRVDPSRDRIIPCWLSGFEISTFRKLDIEMNNFIISSNFWEVYNAETRSKED